MASLVLSGDTSGTVTLAAPAVAGTQSYTLPTAVPAANGYALTSTTGGTMSWAAVTASPAGSTTQVQYNSSGAFAGSANLTFDGSSLTVNSVTVGRGSGAVASNTAIGSGALASGTTVAQCVAVGVGAMNSQLDQGSNAAVGWRSMYLSTSALQCAALGEGSLYNQTTASNNTGVGFQSNYYNVTGTDNASVGYRALFGTSTNSKSYNVGVGSLAGSSLTTGSNNTIVGYNAQASIAAASNQIVLGSGVTGQADTNVTIGSSGGKIYNAYTVNATWTQTSDARLKTNVIDDSLGLSFINRLRPVTFNWKASNEIDPSLPYYNEVNKRDTTTVIHGLIAQEVKAALDAEGCSTFNGWDAGNEDMIQAISREMFISPLIKAIQELSAKLDAANARIAALEAK
jgi:hypothetical protein